MALTTVRSTGISSLPAISGANLTSLNASNIASGTLSTSRYVQGGITVADMWDMTSGFAASTGSANYLTSNWTRATTNGRGTLGTAMTESSGVFTFPSTGIYLVQFQMMTEANQMAADVFMSFMAFTTDNSAYNFIARGRFGQTSEGNSGLRGKTIHAIVDVTDTSTHKVRFGYADASSNVYINGASSDNQTAASFIRLGDT